MGIFGAAHGWGGGGEFGDKMTSLPKICQRYPTMMKLHPLSSADISILSPEIIKFYCIKKYRYRLHFDA